MLYVPLLHAANNVTKSTRWKNLRVYFLLSYRTNHPSFQSGIQCTFSPLAAASSKLWKLISWNNIHSFSDERGAAIFRGAFSPPPQPRRILKTLTAKRHTAKNSAVMFLSFGNTTLAPTPQTRWWNKTTTERHGPRRRSVCIQTLPYFSLCCQMFASLSMFRASQQLLFQYWLVCFHWALTLAGPVRVR